MTRKLSPILRSSGLTVGLNGVLLLTIYALAPAAAWEAGQAALLCATVLLSVFAVCLHGRIEVRRGRELWYCAAVSLPLHLILSVLSAAVYGRRLSYYWPGEDMAWIVFLLMSLSAWSVALCGAALLRFLRVVSLRREEDRRVQMASRGLYPAAAPLSPARARVISSLKGVSWVLCFYTLTGLLLELLTALSVADTILAYVAFPCLWCFMAAVYGLIRRPVPGAFTLSVSVTHLLLTAVILVFLIPSNAVGHTGYAEIFLDSVRTEPFDHPELLLLLAEFLGIWVTAAVCGAGRGGRRTDPAV